jgi:hypothetical protein
MAQCIIGFLVWLKLRRILADDRDSDRGDISELDFMAADPL